MSAPSNQRPRINVRRPDVMELVASEVAKHYQSSFVETLKDQGGKITSGDTTVLLAKDFGFCYGVERAIDLAYASRKVFAENRIFLIGEIIHNPDVNQQLSEMNIVSLPWREMNASYEELSEEDVVIVPAFGAPSHYMAKLEEKGCYVVDTTCGDVMKVWRKVREYAKNGVTSIIHGKADHEETRATASRALGVEGNGFYLTILTLADADAVADFIIHGGEEQAFYERFKGAYSENFQPSLHLQKIGIANQTTMLKGETLEIQKRLAAAIELRDGNLDHFHAFDTICGATQERQDALFEMLKTKMDLLIVVGGYNSSNTAHLVEIGEKELPTFFIRNAEQIRSLEEMIHYDLHLAQEKTTNYAEVFAGKGHVTIGITAGASCPNNLIEATIRKIFVLRGHPLEDAK